MQDSLLAKYASRRDALGDTEQIESDPDDLGAFGWLRGVRDRAVMLELRFKDGSIKARPYTWLEADFDPSNGITLKFGAEKFRITGRNLNAELRPNVRLFAGIVRHRVPWIQEADRSTAMAAEKGAVVIEAISAS